MALTELQLPTKVDFYLKLQRAATEMNNLINKWRDLSEFIGIVTTADLDAIGVASGQVRTDLVAFKQAIVDILAVYDGTSTTPTVSPASIIDKIREM